MTAPVGITALPGHARPEAPSPSARSKVWTAAAILSCWLAAAAVFCAGRPGSVSSPTTSICWPARLGALAVPDRGASLFAGHCRAVQADGPGRDRRRGVAPAGACGPRREHPAGVADPGPWPGDRPALRLGGDDALRAGGSGVRGDRLGGRPGLCAGGIHAAGRGLCIVGRPRAARDGAAPLGHAAAATGRLGNLGLGGPAVADRRDLLVVSILPSGNRGNMSPSPFGRGSG